ncbi:MAG: chorismate-binding protein, partial [Candidatus Nanopelagicales bacterium]
VVDVDADAATLAVGIRTFWLHRTRDAATLNFGTGAGITWGSNPDSEWEESALKARHLTTVAAGEWT